MNAHLSLAIRRDWKIFPLRNRSRLASGQPLLRYATSSETQIEQWENQFSSCAWAVATGSDSGVFALHFSLDAGAASMREFGERDPDLSRTLQVRGPNELVTFLEWPACGLLAGARGILAPGVRLWEEGGYVSIPGPGMSLHRHYEYVDPEAPALPPAEWLMDLIHADSSGNRTARILNFRLSPDAARSVLLSFERRGEWWLCDFYEASGTAKVRQTLAYRSSEKVVSLAIRGGAFMKSSNRSRLYEGLEIGHGRILLNLTSDQYSKLIAA